ncbi:hypothetical protein HKCCE2091_15070, partial [Rhodobacterales bacterium HKCCE2091]|nr:hypothetical protein [Rhodobacterales bacterium HKCCE2091]
MTDPSPDAARMRAILVLVAAIAFAVAPVFSPSFSGFDPADFPNPTPPVPLQPAGWAFSIWGLIYLALVAWAVYGLARRAADPAWDAPRWPLFASLVLGAPWLAVANAAPLPAAVLILAMLGGAVAALARARGLTPLAAAPVGLLAG